MTSPLVCDLRRRSPECTPPFGLIPSYARHRHRRPLAFQITPRRFSPPPLSASEGVHRVHHRLVDELHAGTLASIWTVWFCQRRSPPSPPARGIQPTAVTGSGAIHICLHSRHLNPIETSAKNWVCLAKPPPNPRWLHH